MGSLGCHRDHTLLFKDFVFKSQELQPPRWQWFKRSFISKDYNSIVKLLSIKGSRRLTSLKCQICQALVKGRKDSNSLYCGICHGPVCNNCRENLDLHEVAGQLSRIWCCKRCAAYAKGLMLLYDFSDEKEEEKLLSAHCNEAIYLNTKLCASIAQIEGLMILSVEMPVLEVPADFMAGIRQYRRIVDISLGRLATISKEASALELPVAPAYLHGIRKSLVTYSTQVISCKRPVLSIIDVRMQSLLNLKDNSKSDIMTGNSRIS